MKKTVYSRKISADFFSAENTLKQLDSQREKYIKNWGKEVFHERRESLLKYIKEKKSK